MCEYISIDKSGKKIFLNKKISELIKDLNTIIFDCDGVLLKTDDSYDKSIQKTVDFFFSKIFNTELKDLVKPEDILLIRNTGGFNNDWELTYAFILYYFFQISEHISKKQIIILPKIDNIDASFEHLKNLLNLIGLSSLDPEKIIEPRNYDIKEYISYLDISGLKTSRKVLYSWSENLSQIQFLQRIEEFMRFGQGLENDIITRIFQEFYLGPLLEKLYGFKQILKIEKGDIETEKLNGKIKDYKNLLKLNFNKFGIASSRPRKEAEYILKKEGILPDLVNIDALVFLEDIKEEEDNINKKIGKKISLEKPDPFPIIKSIEKISNVKVIAYIGDTIADIYAAKSANRKLDNPLLSIGFYDLSSDPKLLEEKFRSLKTDIIAPSIKELVQIIEEYKG